MLTDLYEINTCRYKDNGGVIINKCDLSIFLSSIDCLNYLNRDLSEEFTGIKKYSIKYITEYLSVITITPTSKDIENGYCVTECLEIFAHSVKYYTP